jgi:predicted ester cyclase
MSTEENKQFIRRYFDAINGKPKPPAVLDLYMADDDLKAHIQTAEEAFPLYRLDAEEILAEGDLVSVRGWVRGVHRGPFMGVPPTGKTVEFSIFITYRIAVGKIVEHWMLTDNITVMQQIGMMPSPG